MKVKILPRSTVPVIKCNHRHGAKMTFSFQTDARYASSIQAAELYGFKNNFRIGAFINNILTDQYNTDVPQCEATGIFRHDIYYSTDYWKNPNTGNIEVIPDYYNTQWTSVGAAAFGKIIGDSKIIRTPRHGQNMYDISGGKYGYDFINGLFGNSHLSEVYGIDEKHQDWFNDILNRYPSSLSYRNGDNGGYPVHSDGWISGRNSIPSPSSISTPAPTQYGSGLGYPSSANTRSFWLNYPSSFRWWDAINTNGILKTDASNYMTTNIQSTLLNGGWYRDFMHFHAARNNNTMNQIDEFMQIANSAFGSNLVWKCSNGEALEYMFLREITSRVICSENNGMVVIIADIDDKFKGYIANYPQEIPLNRLNIPLSVEVDLSETHLSGKNVLSNYKKIISLGADKYIVEIPFNYFEGFQTVILSEGIGGVINTNIPNGSKTIVGNKMTVTTDIDTRSVLFSVDTGGFIYDSVVSGRSNILSKTHTFEIGTGKDYRIGIISEFGQANLI